MSSAAWKDLERRVCRALGAQRRPSIGPGGYAKGTDDDGTAPFAVEVKRTKRLALRSAWVAQARRNAKTTGKPWLLVIGEHRSQRPIAILDFYTLAQLTQEAGRLPELTIDGKDTMNETETPQPPEAPDEPTDDNDEVSDDEANEKVEKA